MNPRILCLLGTRPEAIKVLPVVRALKEHPAQLVVRIGSTGQHREMLDPVLDFFGYRPDYELALMQPNQSLAGFASAALQGIDGILADYQPQAVLVQGDTHTALMGAWAAFYRRIPVGHIEAGLRSGNPFSPFPEEMNRQLIARLAHWHFAPTPQNVAALRREGIEERIYETGNPVIDALHWANELLKGHTQEPTVLPAILPDRQLILMTCHRRESFGEPLRHICQAVLRIVQNYPQVEVVYPVHLNPNVQQLVNEELGGHDRIHLVPPLDYPDLMRLLSRCRFLLTDSGGLQEEGPAIGKPVVVLREVTERTEAIEAGRAVLVGSDPESIVEWCSRLLSDEDLYNHMSQPFTPYLAGSAAERIAHFVAADLTA